MNNTFVDRGTDNCVYWYADAPNPFPRAPYTVHNRRPPTSFSNNIAIGALGNGGGSLRVDNNTGWVLDQGGATSSTRTGARSPAYLRRREQRRLSLRSVFRRQAQIDQGQDLSSEGVTVDALGSPRDVGGRTTSGRTNTGPWTRV